MEKLIEMANAGVTVNIYGPGALYSSARGWSVSLSKSSDGIDLRIQPNEGDLVAVINDAYERWISATRGLPNHGLRQIEHTPPPFDPSDPDPFADEIPF